MTRQWYCRLEGTEFGPLKPSELKAIAVRGRLKPDDEVRHGETGEWRPAKSIRGLFSSGGSPSEPDEPVAADSLELGLPVAVALDEPSADPQPPPLPPPPPAQPPEIGPEPKPQTIVTHAAAGGGRFRAAGRPLLVPYRRAQQRRRQQWILALAATLVLLVAGAILIALRPAQAGRPVGPSKPVAKEPAAKRTKEKDLDTLDLDRPWNPNALPARLPEPAKDSGQRPNRDKLRAATMDTK